MFDNLAPKPALTAVATLSALLGDAGPPDILALSPGEYGLRFSTPAGRRVALWSEHATTWHLTGSMEACIISRDGTDITPANLVSGVRLTLDADDEPLYLLGEVTFESVTTPTGSGR